MKFTPRAFKENVNITHTSPLRELFVLLGAICGGLLLIYLIMGLALDVLVDRIPDKLDRTVGELFSKAYRLEKPTSGAEIRIQKLLDELVKLMPGQKRRFTVYIQKSPDANALALPGGHILIFSGLLKEIESENELAMVLAHELGHFVHRDHLRGLGRGLVLTFISAVLFGVDSGVSQFTQNILLTVDLKFSRRQESAADMFGLDLLYKKYGHAGGAYDFFERIKTKKSLPRFAKFLSTHPYPDQRVRMLKEQIDKKRYIIEKKVPLAGSFKEWGKE